ncbi:hypothetical protein D3C87_2199360 [compost metagenome]
MPLDPPWMRMVSPAFSPAMSKTLAQTVKKVSGKAAAFAASYPFGQASACVAGTAAYSA